MEPYKARVLVTLACNRKCPNCCNNDNVLSQLTVIDNMEQLLAYREIIISGGEPMLIPGKVLDFVKYLRKANYDGRIYLYSALFNESLKSYYQELHNITDGIHFTLHYEARDREVEELKLLSECGVLRRHWGKSLRLAIDSRLYERYDFSNIDFSIWSIVRRLKWLPECPLPKGERLFLYEL